MDAITEQLAKSMAVVRINTIEWAAGKFGCLPFALGNDNLKIATNRAIVSNTRLPEPATFHPDIKDETKQIDILFLTKVQDERWAAYHIQEAATKIGVAVLVANVEDQYLIKLNEQYVGFRNQTPLTILEHLTKTWVRVQNHEKVESTNAFKFFWSDHPNMRIKTYKIELSKSQRAMVKFNVPCDDALKVITYVDIMHKSGIFKEQELLTWENESNLQGWTKTQNFFNNIWTDRAAFSIRIEGARLSESALAITATAKKEEDVEEAM